MDINYSYLVKLQSSDMISLLATVTTDVQFEAKTVDNLVQLIHAYTS